MGVSLRVTARCPTDKVTLGNGQCGCRAGEFLVDGECTSCPDRLSSAVGATSCDICAAGYLRTPQDAIPHAPLVSNALWERSVLAMLRWPLFASSVGIGAWTAAPLTYTIAATMQRRVRARPPMKLTQLPLKGACLVLRETSGTGVQAAI